MNFTVTSQGRQFDRLGLMYLGDIEVFRTSTAEPSADGIVWTYVKEMEEYNALWEKDQKVIFDLGNIVNEVYTGPYYTTLTATFFTIPDSRPTADIILPISAKQSAENMGSAFSVPGQNASVSYTLPQNTERAVISLSACGQATEEFWYTNAFNSEVNTFESTAGTLYGFSPFREVQLLIDGQLAGVSWPFPIIFTGGIVPGFWRPIVGIDAFDLRQHEIDVTPFLPLLCDSFAHTFEIRIAGLTDDGAGHASLSEIVGSYWVVTGTIFLFSATNESVTTGTSPSIDTPLPEIQISSSIITNSTGANETLTYDTAVTRDISITSTVKTASGSKKASWTQSLSYSNFNSLTDQGFVQLTIQNTTGSDLSSSGYANTYNYPLDVNSSFSVDQQGEVGINGTLSRGLNFNVFGPSVFPSGIQNFNITTPSFFSPDGALTHQNIQLSASYFSGALLSTTQTASAEYFSGINSSYSFGTTTQDFDFKGAEYNPDVTFELYHRQVMAVNSTITEDEQTLVGETFGIPVAQPGENVPAPAFEGFSVRSLLGRGPGQPKAGLMGGGGS
ncbi:MAG: hypothetical protein ASARMPREDX12_003044 [Alectoria sarmentosa]|nr:MAG: hypothetical protein ASARMPREDX12_003044 [Alectoria sarmentosa]